MDGLDNLTKSLGEAGDLIDRLVAERDSARAENAALRERVAVLERVEEWTHRFGSELSPSGKWTDSFGDGVRAAKERVSLLLAAAKPAAQEGKEDGR